jgi:uncharacterized linocin/CFP29 family protein
MNDTNLGRDKIPWSKDIWDNIDRSVHDVVNAIRIAAKVLPVRPYPGARSVPTGEIDYQNPAVLEAVEGQEAPFVEISRGFSLSEAEVKGEDKLGTAAMLARVAATAVAQAEDMIIFQGGNVVGQPGFPPGVTTLRANSANQGLLGVAAENPDQAPPVQAPPGAPPGQFREATFGAVTGGITELLTRGQPGPYALLLPSGIFADTEAPIPNLLIATADRIKPLVPGGFYGTGTLPPNTGLLLSLGGEPTTIAVSLDATTAFTQQDQQGRYQFRVFERIQFVARDRRALLGLTFVPNPAADAARGAAAGGGQPVAVGDGHPAAAGDGHPVAAGDGHPAEAAAAADVPA